MAWKEILVLIILYSCCYSCVLADNRDPIMRTNVNQQTDLFKDSIADWGKVQEEITTDRKDSLEHLSCGHEAEFLKGIDNDKNAVDRNAAKSVRGDAESVSHMSYEDATSKGRSQMMQDNTINELYVDYTKPLYKAYLEDAKELAKEQDNFIKNNLTSKLKELGVDCKTEKGNKMVETEFYLQTTTRAEAAHNAGHGKGDTRYNQTICEELRNTYQCYDELTMNCIRFSEKEFDAVKFYSSDIGYGYSAHGGISNYSFDTNCVGTTCVQRGKQPNVIKRIMGKKKNKHKETHISGSEDFSIYFDINDDMEVIHRLELQDIQYNGVMSISLNDTNIGVLPIGGNSLNIVDTHTMRSGGKKNKKWTKTYSVISNGYNKYVLTYEHDTGDSGNNIQHILSKQSYGYLNLKHYARRGRNALRIKIVSLDGYVRFNFRISERICLEWQEIWDEKCQLK